MPVFLIEFRNSPEKKKAERTAEEQEMFGSWKRFGRKQPKTTLERPRPGDSVIVRMRGPVVKERGISAYKMPQRI